MGSIGIIHIDGKNVTRESSWPKSKGMLIVRSVKTKVEFWLNRELLSYDMGRQFVILELEQLK